MKLKNVTFPTIISLVFVLVFLNQLIFRIDQPLNDPDSFYQYFLLENNLSKFASFDFGSLFNTRMFYPHDNTLAFGNSQFIQSLLAFPLYLLTKNVIVSAHFMILANFFLAFFSMYLLAFRLTNSKWSAVTAGLIFSYNPYVMAQFYFELLTIFWIPLIFFTTESFLQKPTFYKGMALPILFLLQLISSFYYALFIAIVWPIYLALRLYLEQNSFKKLFNKGFLIGGIILLIGGFLYLRPYVEMKENFKVTRSLAGINLHSAKPIDFFATSPYNKVYGKLTKSDGLIGLWRGQDFKSYYEQHYTEHSLFPGIVVYGLLITSLALLVKGKFSNQTKLVIPLLVVLLLAILFSFGPSLPLYLLMYKFVPFVDSLRAPSRFMVMGFFSLSLLSSFALKTKTSFLVAIVIFLIVLEYQHQITPPFVVKAETQQFYSFLGKQKDIKVIVELPMANSLSNHPTLFRTFFDESKYLLYGIYHHKKIVNGNAAFIPPEFIDLGNSLIVNFPTRAKIADLKEWGVDALVIHRDEYKEPKTAEDIIDKLRRFGLTEIYKSEQISAFIIE